MKYFSSRHFNLSHKHIISKHYKLFIVFFLGFIFSPPNIFAGIISETIATYQFGDSGYFSDGLEQYYPGFVGPPVMNNNGDVAFMAYTMDRETNNREIGIVLHSNKTSSVLVDTTEIAPNTSNDYFTRFNTPSMLTDSGTVIGTAKTESSNLSFNYSYASNTSGTSELWNNSNHPAPIISNIDSGISGVSLSRVNTKKYNPDGSIFFTAELNGSGVTDTNNVALYKMDTFGNATLILRTGDQVPGMPEGTVFSTIPYNSYPSIGRAFDSASDQTAIMSIHAIDSSGENVSVVAVYDGTNVSAFETPTTIASDVEINSHGDTMHFESHFIPSPESDLYGHYERKFYTNINGEITELYPDSILNLSDGQTRQEIVIREGFELNNKGTIAFLADTKKDDHWATDSLTGLYLDTGNSIELVAEVDTVPASDVYQRLSSILSFQLNNNNQVVIDGRLSGSSYDSDEILLMTNEYGELEKILREGQPINLSETEIKSVSGWSGSYNDRGELALVVSFTDNTTAIMKFSTFFDAVENFAISDSTTEVVLLEDNASGSGQLTVSLEGVNLNLEENIASTLIEVNYETPDLAALEEQYGDTEGWQELSGNLLLQGENKTQLWDLHIDSLWEGWVELTFNYDESLLAPGVDENLLGIWHYGTFMDDLTEKWRFYDSYGEYSDYFTIDTVNNLITIQLDNLSPSVLDVGNGPANSVPTPATLALMLLGLIGIFSVKRKQLN